MEKLQQLLKSKNVALVGSSNHLKRSGDKIDGFEVVIRFNMALPTIENSVYIGGKTDIIACNHHVSKAIIDQNYERYIRKNFVSLEYCDRFKAYLATKLPAILTRGKVGTSLIKNKIIGIEGKPRQFCNKVIENVGKKYPKLRGLKINKKPRMGFYLVCILISLKIKPTLFYFDIAKPSYKKFYGTKQFYDEKAKSKKPKTHDIRTECLILKKLLKLNLININKND